MIYGIYLVLSLVGLILCIRLKSGNKIFIFGILFFLLKSLDSISIILANYILRYADNELTILRGHRLSIVSGYLDIFAYIILVSGFIYAYAKRKR